MEAAASSHEPGPRTVPPASKSPVSPRVREITGSIRNGCRYVHMLSAQGEPIPHELWVTMFVQSVELLGERIEDENASTRERTDASSRLAQVSFAAMRLSSQEQREAAREKLKREQLELRKQEQQSREERREARRLEREQARKQAKEAEQAKEKPVVVRPGQVKIPDEELARFDPARPFAVPPTGYMPRQLWKIYDGQIPVPEVEYDVRCVPDWYHHAQHRERGMDDLPDEVFWMGRRPARLPPRQLEPLFTLDEVDSYGQGLRWTLTERGKREFPHVPPETTASMDIDVRDPRAFEGRREENGNPSPPDG